MHKKRINCKFLKSLSHTRIRMYIMYMVFLRSFALFLSDVTFLDNRFLYLQIVK